MTLRRVRLVRLRRAGDAQRGGSERVDTPSRQRIGVFLLAQLREHGLGGAPPPAPRVPEARLGGGDEARRAPRGGGFERDFFARNVRGVVRRLVVHQRTFPERFLSRHERRDRIEDHGPAIDHRAQRRWVDRRRRHRRRTSRDRRRVLGLGPGQHVRRAQEFADAETLRRRTRRAVRAVSREFREPVDDEKRGARVVVVALGEEARAFGH